MTEETTVCRDECLHPASRVIDSRPSGYPHIIQTRRRECLDCKMRYSTVEVYLSDFEELARYDRERKLERLIKKGLQRARAYGSNFSTE